MGHKRFTEQKENEIVAVCQTNQLSPEGAYTAILTKQSVVRLHMF